MLIVQGLISALATDLFALLAAACSKTKSTGGKSALQFIFPCVRSDVFMVSPGVFGVL